MAMETLVSCLMRGRRVKMIVGVRDVVGGRVGAHIIFMVCRIMNLVGSPPSLKMLLPHAESIAKHMAATSTPIHR